MSTNVAAVNAVLALVEQLQAQETQAQADVASAEERLASIRANVEHARVTAQLLSETVDTASALLALEWGAKLDGLTHLASIIRIAEESGDILEPKKAAAILTATGHWKGKPQNLGPVIYNHMRDSGRFRRLQQGKYRLIRKQPTPLSATLAVTHPHEAVEEPSAA